MKDLAWWDEFCVAHPQLYHVTSADRIDAILTQGLCPVGEDVEGRSAAGCRARPGCVYLGSEGLWLSGWLHEWTGVAYCDQDAVTVVVRTAALDPAYVWPDEDSFTSMTGPEIDPGAFSLEPPRDGEDTGVWAARVRLGDQPGAMRAGWESRESIAYEGIICDIAVTAEVD